MLLVRQHHQVTLVNCLRVHSVSAMNEHVVRVLRGTWTGNIARLLFIEHPALVTEVDKAASVIRWHTGPIRLHNDASLHHVAVLTRTVRVGRHHRHIARHGWLATGASLHLKSTNQIHRAVNGSAAGITGCDGRACAMMARRSVLLGARLNFAAVIGGRALTCVPALLLRTVADHNWHTNSLHTTAVFGNWCADEL